LQEQGDTAEYMPQPECATPSADTGGDIGAYEARGAERAKQTLLSSADTLTWEGRLPKPSI